MSFVSLLTRFCLFRAPWMCLAEKMSRNPTSSLFSFLCCTRQLINAVIYHVFTFFQNRVQNYSFFMRFLQLRMFFSSQSVIFLALTGFYDWICKEVTHVWIEIWFSSFLIFVYIHLYDIREAKVTCFLSLPCRLMHQARHKLFRKDDILHIKKGTGDRLMYWYVLHLVALRDTDLSPVPLFLRHTQVSNAFFCTYIFTLLLTSETSIIESTFCLRIVF